MATLHYSDNGNDHLCFDLDVVDELNVYTFCSICERWVRIDDCYNSTPWG